MDRAGYRIIFPPSPPPSMTSAFLLAPSSPRKELLLHTQRGSQMGTRVPIGPLRAFVAVYHLLTLLVELVLWHCVAAKPVSARLVAC